jgi:hypothetical protein
VDRPLRSIGGASSPGGPIGQIISSLLLFAMAFGIFYAAVPALLGAFLARPLPDDE